MREVAVGAVVSVWWPLDEAWYQGTVREGGKGREKGGGVVGSRGW